MKWQRSALPGHPLCRGTIVPLRLILPIELLEQAGKRQVRIHRGRQS